MAFPRGLSAAVLVALVSVVSVVAAEAAPSSRPGSATASDATELLDGQGGPIASRTRAEDGEWQLPMGDAVLIDEEWWTPLGH